MKSYRLDHPGSIEGLVIHKGEIPAPGQREVLVRIRANSLNARDLGIVYGVRKIPIGAVPLTDGAGTVEALGAGVHRFKAGDRVVTAFHPDWTGGPRPPLLRQDLNSVDGVLAEYVVVHEEALVPFPGHLSFEEAATLPCAALAAWNALVSYSPLVPGETVLVQGTGGVSIFALQFAKLFGARIIAMSSTAAKLERLRALGADATVNYVAEPDWEVPVRKLTGNHGVDLVVEVASLAGYHRIEAELARLAFVRDHSEGAPICRWKFGGVAVDLMPSDERILGFANRWYPRMMQEADRVALPGGKVIRLVTAPLFVASKFEAFADRGAGDLLASHDLEDIVTLIAGRPELAGEAALADGELRGYLAQRCAGLLAAPGFMNFLPGMLLHDDTLDERVAVVAERLRVLAADVI